MGCYAPLRRVEGGAQQSISVTARCGNLLLSVSADVRTSDDVIASSKAVPNNKVGVVLMRPATNSNVGLAYNGTAVPPATVISGNKASGIVSNAAGTQVSNCRIGVGRDGFTLVPNIGTGVTFLSDAINSNVGDTSSGKAGEAGYTAGSKPFSFLSVISGNNGDGVRSFAKNTVVNNAHVGFALVVTQNSTFYRRTPNTGAGLNFQDGADSPRVGYTWPVVKNPP